MNSRFILVIEREKKISRYPFKSKMDAVDAAYTMRYSQSVDKVRIQDLQTGELILEMNGAAA